MITPTIAHSQKHAADSPAVLELTAALTERHLHMLRDESAITQATIEARGYFSLHVGNGTVDTLIGLGFDHKQALGVSQGDVLVIPICPPDGSSGAVMVRPDIPRTFDVKEKKLPDGTHPQKVLKYEQPKGAANRLDVNPLCRAALADPGVDLWITEGVKKGDALAAAGLCAVALPGGVYGYMGANGKGASTVTADLDHIAWRSKQDGTRRRVYIVFDSDVMTKDQVQQALRRLSAILTNRGAHVVPVVLPSTPNRGKQGVDDFLAAGGTVAHLLQLAATSELSLTVLAGPGSTKRLKTEDYIQTLAGLGYSFRMNDLDDTVECNGEPLTDATVARIKSHLRDHGIDTVNIAEEAWTAYASVNRYHPIRDYLAGLEWDGIDHLGRLLGFFEDSERTASHPCPVFGTYLKHWQIGAVAKVLDPGTHNQNAMLVLEGAQGVGKSHFAAWLAGAVPDYYIESAIHPDNKDNRLALANRWIWEVLELSSTTRRADVDALKGFITTAWVSERKAYGHYPIRKPAIASFLGTVNMGSTGFLVDETGSRRFYTVTVTKIDHGYSTAVCVNQLWAQAVALWRKGETWRLSKAMTAKQTELNHRYEAETDILDWLLRHYEITRNPDDFEAIPDMTAKLQDIGYRGGNTWAISREIAKALKREQLTVTQRRMGEGRPKGFIGIRARLP